MNQLNTNSNIYLYPRYKKTLEIDLANFIKGETFGDWNLGDLYTDIPMNYAKKMGAKFGIFCATGTAGLHASLIALGLNPGDEVIVPSMTFIRATTPLSHLGLKPVIIDIDKETGNLDPEKIELAITEKTKAVIVVHMWGIPANCDRLRQVCDKNNLQLIEDFSHAHFSQYKDKFVGSFGDVSFASLQRKKTISVGEGGIIVTSNEEIFSKLKEITSPGSFDISKNYSDVDFSGFGLNLRMSPFSAVVAKNLYSQIDEIIENKAYTLKVLTNIIKEKTNKIILASIPEYSRMDKISWYSYKPQLNGINLESLKKLNLWKFGDFGYSPIETHRYWQKDSNYFPFSNQIQPELRSNLEGHNEYLTNRISLSLPYVEKEYWSSEMMEKWGDELSNL